jgi:hypothetical protein
MSVSDRFRARLFAPIGLARNRPAWAIFAACLCFSTGVIGAMWLDSASPGLRAQGGSDFEEDSVWPVMSHSFPQEIDLLAPEPLLTPVSSLGPSRADTPTLAAALRSATENPVRPEDPIIEAAPSAPASGPAPTMQRRKPVRPQPAEKRADNPPTRSTQRPDARTPAPRKQDQSSRRDESAPPEQQRLFD